MDRKQCECLWGTNEFEFVVKAAEGRSSGLPTIWNSIRNEAERKGVGEFTRKDEMYEFDFF